MPEHTDTIEAYNCPISIKQKIQAKEDSEEITDYEHKKAKDYLTQEHNSLITEMIASKHSSKVLHQ
jgi:hypothetical protein